MCFFIISYYLIQLSLLYLHTNNQFVLDKAYVVVVTIYLFVGSVQLGFLDLFEVALYGLIV